MERLESGTAAESVESVTEIDEEIRESPERFPEEEYPSLEYDYYNFVGVTDTPSFDEISELEEANDPTGWVLGQQVYSELDWSDSDQSEIDFELSVDHTAFDVSGNSTTRDSSGSGPQKKNNIKYLKIRSGDIVKKISLNISDISNTYLDKVRRLENYKKFLKMTGKTFEKEKGKDDDDVPVIVTPDESELEGLSEEEKAKKREIWLQELAKVEEEIRTLKEVLRSKISIAQGLKRKLGISVWKELTDDITHGVQTVKESNVYHNVEEKFSQLGKAVTDTPIYQKTESVVKATAEGTRNIIGGLTGGLTQKIGQLKNSESFKSFEEKIGSAYENVKTKVSSRSSSMQNFDEALREESVTRHNSVSSLTIPEGKPLS